MGLVSEASIVTLIVALLAVLGGGGFWSFRQSRRDAPIRQGEANIVAADKSVQMALAVAEDLRHDYTRLREDFTNERGERLQLTGRVSTLETHIREQERTIGKLRDGIRAFSAAWDDIAARWGHHRQQDHPPAKPLINIE